MYSSGIAALVLGWYHLLISTKLLVVWYSSCIYIYISLVRAKVTYLRLKVVDCVICIFYYVCVHLVRGFESDVDLLDRVVSHALDLPCLGVVFAALRSVDSKRRLDDLVCELHLCVACYPLSDLVCVVCYPCHSHCVCLEVWQLLVILCLVYLT